MERGRSAAKRSLSRSRSDATRAGATPVELRMRAEHLASGARSPHPGLKCHRFPATWDRTMATQPIQSVAWPDPRAWTTISPPWRPSDASGSRPCAGSSARSCPRPEQERVRRDRPPVRPGAGSPGAPRRGDLGPERLLRRWSIQLRGRALPDPGSRRPAEAGPATIPTDLHRRRRPATASPSSNSTSARAGPRRS